MGNAKVKFERRHQKRFKVAEGAFAAIVDRGSKLGQIKDISKKGLAFRYIDSEEQPDDARELKIIIGSGGVYIDKLPFKKVADFAIESEFSFSSIRMRQIGLKFGRLSSEQQSRLEHFIQYHTLGEA